MSIFNKPLELPPQLKWRYAREPELLGWTIRARNYNTFVANCMFWFCFITITVGAILLGPDTPGGPGFTGMSAVLGYILVNIALISMTHQRMNFAYRFTRSGVEECEWKDFPQWALTVLKWMIGFTAILFIFLATIDPAFLVGALIGPGGLGLTYLSMAHSKDFREMHTQYHHYAYKWKDFTQLAIATNREVVDLSYRITMKGRTHQTVGSVNVFCKRKQKDNVANFIKPYISPDIPFIRAKVDVPMSTD